MLPLNIFPHSTLSLLDPTMILLQLPTELLQAILRFALIARGIKRGL
jgi:hypothetical protein